jgi:hypothetical protein
VQLDACSRNASHTAMRMPRRQRQRAPAINFQESVMGKYFLAWLFGVPAIVLVLIYFFLH